MWHFLCQINYLSDCMYARNGHILTHAQANISVSFVAFPFVFINASSKSERVSVRAVSLVGVLGGPDTNTNILRCTHINTHMHWQRIDNMQDPLE